MTKSFASTQSDSLFFDPDSPRIVRAAERDSPVLAQLFRISSDGVVEDIWIRTALCGEPPLRAGSRLHASAAGALSYRNALVAKRADRVIGMVLGCSIFDLTHSRKIIDPILPRDLQLDEPHNVIVLGLGVFPESRNQGIGSRLLTALERQTSVLETGRIGVVCPDRNSAARSFLEHRGYREIAGRQDCRSGPLTVLYKLFFEELS